MTKPPHRPLPYPRAERRGPLKQGRPVSVSLGIFPRPDEFPLFAGRGYALGGHQTSGGADNIASIERFTRSSEVIVTLNNSLPAAMSEGGAGINSRHKGFILGGKAAADVATILAMPFATETTANISATLGAVKSGGPFNGISNQISKGYSPGGWIGAASNLIDDFAFATETSARIAAVLTSNVFLNGGTSSTVAGYSMGGAVAGTPAAAIDKLAFATEAKSTLAAAMTTASHTPAGVVESSLKGFYMGGESIGGVLLRIEALVFGVDTCGTIAATLDLGQRGGAGWSFADRGYTAGGEFGSGVAAITSIEDMIYAGETSVTIATVLAARRTFCGAFNTPVNV